MIKGVLVLINYVIIGGGWRSEFYLRIAKRVPEVFNVSAICVRNDERAGYIHQKFGVKVVKTVDEALKQPFDFIVNCINKDDISDFSVELADMGHYVLAETPVTKLPSGNHNYANIQVAEQFHLKGSYQAIKKIIDSKIIGDVEHINISVAHDYHAMSLIRFLLDDYNKPKLLYEHKSKDDILKTNGREGILENKEIKKSCQTVKMYQFQNATVIYDYNTEQYFSPIRKDRLLIRGTNGEIENNHVRYYNSHKEFVSSDTNTVMSGLLDGLYYDKITFENKVLFDFPFKSARLSEEEIAIADCLLKMNNYIQTGNELYNYEKAYEDYRLFNNPNTNL